MAPDIKSGFYRHLTGPVRTVDCLHTGMYYEEPPKPKPVEWESIESYNPDEHPSFSKIFKTEIAPDRTRWVLQVAGFGVLIIRTDSECRPRLYGASEFSKEELGYSPKV
jgi:hypothetical protein